MSDDAEDFNTDAILTGIDHVRAAKAIIRKAIRKVANARIDGGSISGRSLDDHLEELTDAEMEISRAEGNLAP